MLPMMPPIAEACKLSYKEFDNLDNMEKAIFSIFLESAYDDADSNRLAWAPDHSGQIFKAFHNEMAENEKYIIYANGDFAGFYVILTDETQLDVANIFVSRLFGTNITSEVEEYLVTKTL